MKRHLICITTLLSIFFLNGCNSEQEKKLSPDTIIVEPVIIEHKIEKKVILTLGSWRKEDVQQINYILDQFNKKHPNIVIKFDPTNPAEYNDVIEAQLESNTAPDLLYLRSFSHSRAFFDKGYLSSLNDLSPIKETFPTHILNSWSSNKGEIYAVPLMAVSHGIFYNASIFNKLDLSLPDTWQELLALAKKLKQNKILPFANATGDAWTINGLLLQNVIPNLIGGIEGRLEYYHGERCFNDEQMVASFQSVKDIAPYISKNQQLLKYADSLQLFIQGKSAMYFGGSWDIPFFESQNVDFEWSEFAIPAPKGNKTVVTFHPDAGIGLNKDSPYKKEARLFLQWMMSEEFSSLIAQQLPGFFPMHNKSPKTDNVHARAFLDFNEKYETDIRFVWGQIRDGSPSAYELSLSASIDVMNNIITPQQAADDLQAGLASWYLPASQCQK